MISFLLSESSQYMAAVDIAQGAANILDDGGYLLLADMMRSDASYRKGFFLTVMLSQNFMQH
jgi:MPBQ/MSBQ methyltransferase